jgi:hypothetical protein
MAEALYRPRERNVKLVEAAAGKNSLGWWRRNPLAAFDDYQYAFRPNRFFPGCRPHMS